ncbi:MAG: hypothetical protein IT584_00555 [Chlamydiae bacterium]|nr:hypothetical protein [Chlamydiota bacterium]
MSADADEPLFILFRMMMDKRSILFVLCVTVTFFAMHMWFGDPQREHLKLREAQKMAAVEQVRSPAMLVQSGDSMNYDSSEELYVLENRYQQLVFSNR